MLKVDAVLEDRRGRVIGIEVKAASTVGPGEVARTCPSGMSHEVGTTAPGGASQIASSVEILDNRHPEDFE